MGLEVFLAALETAEGVVIQMISVEAYAEIN